MSHCWGDLMFWRRLLELFLGLSLGLVPGGVALALCPTPNPNLTPGHPPHFVDDCPLPAAGLNAAFESVTAPVPPMSMIDNKAGSITADRGTLTVATSPELTAQQIYNQAVMSGSGIIFNGGDAIRGVGIANPNSTVNTVTGAVGYTYNNTVPSGQRTQTVSVQAIAVCAVGGSNCWGFDALVSDNPALTNTGVTAGTGKYLTNEFDLNITNPNSYGNGLAVGGTSLPANITVNFQGFSVTKLWGASGQESGTALWSNGFIAADGCCATGISIGAKATTGNNIDAMPMVFNYRDGAGVMQNATLGALGGKLYAGGTAGFGYATPNLSNMNGYLVGAQAGSGANVPSQNIVWNYFDAAAAPQSYGMQVNAARSMSFTSSVGNTVANFDFEGGLSVNGNIGVTCAAGTVNAATMTVSNGLVTHC
jgi:hypothetical protein